MGAREVVYSARQHFEAPNWSRDGRELLFNQEGSHPRAAARQPSAAPHRHRQRHALQQRSRAIARRTLAGPSATHRRTSRSSTSCRRRGWRPAPGDGEGALLLARLVSRRHDARLLRGARRRVRRLHGPGRGWRGDAAHHRAGARRRPRLRARRPHLVQLGAHGRDEDLAHGRRWQEPDADDAQRGDADWFPHPSHPGKLVVFLSYDRSVEGHPPNKDVVSAADADRGRRAEGRGEAVRAARARLNVPSWSPDSRRFAFVSYRLDQ